MWNKKPWVDSKIRNFDYIADHLAPEVSSADAGKVMTVDDDGKWIAGSSGGSGGGSFVEYLVPNIDLLLAEGYDVEPITINTFIEKISACKLIKLVSFASSNSGEVTWDLTFSGADNYEDTPSEVYFTGTRTIYYSATDTASVDGYRAVAEVTNDGALYCELV